MVCFPSSNDVFLSYEFTWFVYRFLLSTWKVVTAYMHDSVFVRRNISGDSIVPPISLPGLSLPDLIPAKKNVFSDVDTYLNNLNCHPPIMMLVFEIMSGDRIVIRRKIRWMITSVIHNSENNSIFRGSRSYDKSGCQAISGLAPRYRKTGENGRFGLAKVFCSAGISQKNWVGGC